jgi:hypothetical protein
LEYIHFKDDSVGDEIDTSFIKKEGWKHDSFDIAESFRAVIYNSFELKEVINNERVFAWQGIENGVYVLYFFSRMEGGWYLVKKVDLST